MEQDSLNSKIPHSCDHINDMMLFLEYIKIDLKDIPNNESLINKIELVLKKAEKIRYINMRLRKRVVELES